MTPARLREAERIFHEVVEAAPELQADLLRQRCGADADLRRMVDDLLGRDQDMPAEFLRTPVYAFAGNADGQAAASSDGVESGAVDSPPLQSVGSYEIVRVLGEGGMGVVYEARQQNPRRTVALKVIRPGFATPDMIRRFRHEADVLGRLAHPGIAQVYEAGVAELSIGGRVLRQPFFAMEFVRGRPLRTYVESVGLSPAQRLELMARVADAVHHAHQNSVVHRDLKPANILVTDPGMAAFDSRAAAAEPSPAKPPSGLSGASPSRLAAADSAGATPKILDFGVARSLDAESARATLATSPGQLIGTLPYMSPEQLSGDPMRVDARCDVYALGVITYELLAGRLPYDLPPGSLPQAVRVLQESEPRPLGRVSPALRGDVEAIVAKALEKDAARRYPSAAEFAADIRRHLRDEPIAARPLTTLYQLGKFARRNRALVGGVAAAFALLVLGIVGTSIGLLRARSAERVAQAERASAVAARDESEAARRGEAEQRRAAEAALARANLEADKAGRINQFLSDMLSSADPHQLRGRDLTVRQVLDEAAARMNGAFPDQAEVESSLRRTIGTTYRELSEYAAARPQLERALELSRAARGDDHPDTAVIRSDLGLVLREVGAPEQSDALLTSAIAALRGAGDAYRDELATALQNKGILELQRGAADAAETALAEALELRRARFGAESSEAASILNDLAFVAEEKGDYPKARGAFEQALAIYRKKLPAGHPHVASILTNVGRVAQRQADWTAAEDHFRTALAIREAALGDRHMRIGESYANLAGVFQARGELDQALPLYRRAIEIYKATLGSGSYDTSTVMNNCATTLSGLGRHAEALEVLGEALDIRRRVLGEDHVETAMTRYNMAAAYRWLGRYDEALELLSACLASLRKQLGDEHPYVAVVASGSARVLRLAGRSAEAVPLARQALKIRRQTLGDDHPDVADSLTDEAWLLWDGGDYQSSEPLLREALSICVKAYGEEHAYTGKARGELAACLVELREYAEAESQLKQALASMQTSPADLQQQTQTAQHRLASLYERTGRAGKAAEFRASTQAASAPASAPESPDERQ